MGLSTTERKRSAPYKACTTFTRLSRWLGLRTGLQTRATVRRVAGQFARSAAVCLAYDLATAAALRRDHARPGDRHPLPGLSILPPVRSRGTTQGWHALQQQLTMHSACKARLRLLQLAQKRAWHTAAHCNICTPRAGGGARHAPVCGRGACSSLARGCFVRMGGASHALGACALAGVLSIFVLDCPSLSWGTAWHPVRGWEEAPLMGRQRLAPLAGLMMPWDAWVCRWIKFQLLSHRYWQRFIGPGGCRPGFASPLLRPRAR